jgi:hypothetical protein
MGYVKRVLESRAAVATAREAVEVAKRLGLAGDLDRARIERRAEHEHRERLNDVVGTAAPRRPARQYLSGTNVWSDIGGRT